MVEGPGVPVGQSLPGSQAPDVNLDWEQVRGAYCSGAWTLHCDPTSYYVQIATDASFTAMHDLVVERPVNIKGGL